MTRRTCVVAGLHLHPGRHPGGRHELHHQLRQQRRNRMRPVRHCCRGSADRPDDRPPPKIVSGSDLKDEGHDHRPQPRSSRSVSASPDGQGLRTRGLDSLSWPSGHAVRGSPSRWADRTNPVLGPRLRARRLRGGGRSTSSGSAHPAKSARASACRGSITPASRCSSQAREGDPMDGGGARGHQETSPWHASELLLT